MHLEIERQMEKRYPLVSEKGESSLNLELSHFVYRFSVPVQCTGIIKIIPLFLEIT